MASEKQQQSGLTTNPTTTVTWTDLPEEVSAYLNRIESDKATAVKALREIADERLKGIYGLQQIAQAALDALESEAGR